LNVSHSQSSLVETDAYMLM